MANRQKNQFWLPKDKISFKIVKDQINFIETYYLTIDQSINLIFNNSNNTNDEHKHIKYTSIFKEINNAKSQLNSIMAKLSKVKITINKNLKNKKINAFKNFIIRFFTFGKINRNKNIESEILTFKSDCQKLKDKSKDIIQKLDDETNKFLIKIGQKHIFLEKQLTESEVKKQELEIKNQAYQKKIGELQQELEIKNQEISELQQENIEYQKVQNEHNDKYVTKFITLETMLKAKDQVIKILKQNQELKTKNESTDSGNDSTSETLANINNFDKDKINNEEQKLVTRKNRNKVRIVEINNPKVINTEEERKKFININ